MRFPVKVQRDGRRCEGNLNYFGILLRKPRINILSHYSLSGNCEEDRLNVGKLEAHHQIDYSRLDQSSTLTDWHFHGRD
jgi:hypothetical protein